MGTESVVLETAWRLRSPVGGVMQCTIRPAENGSIVQVAHDASEVARVCRVANIRRARQKAEEWRATLLSLSEFAEVDRD